MVIVPCSLSVHAHRSIRIRLAVFRVCQKAEAELLSLQINDKDLIKDKAKWRRNPSIGKANPKGTTCKIQEVTVTMRVDHTVVY